MDPVPPISGAQGLPPLVSLVVSGVHADKAPGEDFGPLAC